jgi:CRP-like cAMP-binding protein
VSQAAERHDATSDVERLREVGLFGGLGDDVLAEFARSLPQVELAPGTLVFREGDPGRELFVLLEGEVEVLRRTGAQLAARIAVLGPGDWFGEMSILDLLPRSASVRVISPVRAMRIGARDLELLYRRDLKSYSLLVLNLARELSRRLRVADGLVAEYASSSTEDPTAPGR